jgi:hypothetical protein
MGRKKSRYTEAVKEEILNLFNASVPILVIAKKLNIPNTSVRAKIIELIGKEKYDEQMVKTKLLSSKKRITEMVLNRIISAQEKLEKKDED